MSVIKKLAAASILPASLLAYRAYYESNRILTVSSYQVDIPGFPRTVQISDLHKRKFGEKQAQLIRRVAELRPDLIVITGDLVSRSVKDFHETAWLLRRLRALAPILAVPGNHELDLKPMQYEEYRRMMQHCGVRLLENETVLFGDVWFSGITLTRRHYVGTGFLHKRGILNLSATDLEETLGTCREDTVLLAHDPLRFSAYAEWGARLTLAGHVHGGAVRLPGIGGVFSPTRKFFPPYSKGMYRIGKSEMIVSAGLGKLRLMNPPDLCLITGE